LHGYPDAIIFGHALEGNLHFVFTQDFNAESEVDRYRRFMAALCPMVVEKYDGSLKAEHGTGVNMAPFVELEWGKPATELMWEIKRLADPEGLLGPGVILNRDPACHLENLKTTPEVEEAVNTCVECGFCEPVCPSRDLTTTPRQRIVLRREMARQPEGSPVLEALLDEYEYDGLRTCAADGTCALACPLAIDTGSLVKDLRARQRTHRAEAGAAKLASSYAGAEASARRALAAGHRAAWLGGDGLAAGLSGAARAAAGPELVPAWVPPMPPPADVALPLTSREGAAAVYLPACINRIFGTARTGKGPPSLPDALVEVSARAGLPLWIPPDAPGHCCGTPWSSKGYRDGHAVVVQRTVTALWEWSAGGELPVVIDASSCTHGLLESAAALGDTDRERLGSIEVLDSIAWARGHLLDGLEVARKVGSVTVHPTCAARHLGLDRPLRELALALADDVRVPIAATCCGFAGDRGFLQPELTAAATADEAAEIAAAPESDAYVCANRTCETGLERATGKPWESFVFLLEELTRPEPAAISANGSGAS